MDNPILDTRTVVVIAGVSVSAGWLSFVSILLKFVLTTGAALLLVATTPFPDICHALRRLGLPALFVSQLSFLYRYLFVLADEVFRLLRARESRSAAATGARSGGSVAWRAGVAGNMAGQLFLRSYERSDRVYNAMLARGYTGHMQTMTPHVLRRVDYVVTIMAILFLLLLQLAGRL